MFVSAIHALIVLAQPLVGILYARDASTWLTCYLELCFLLCAGFLLLAFLSEVLFAALGMQLQAQSASPKIRASEALESLRAMLVFSGFAAWPRYLLRLDQPTALLFTLAEAQPEAPASVGLYAAKLFLVTLLVDFYMYWKHRALHHPALFCFHKQHHSFPNPSPFASFAVAPVEATLTFAPVLLLCLPQAPVWAHAYGVWTAGFVLLNLYLHAGYTLPWLEAVLQPLGLNSSAFHNIHHESGGSRNFGELCYIWDSLLGSGEHPLKAKSV
jgi:sterol desaturase/sphingolipid hydroxylase (fatty acid hydroxylase superfamily)